MPDSVNGRVAIVAKLTVIIVVAIFLIALLDPVIREDIYEKCDQEDCSGKTACVTIYQHTWQGLGWYQCLTFVADECTTLNPWWIEDGSRVSAADNHNSCIRLYENEDCTGHIAEIPGREGKNKLETFKFDEKAKSVSSCKREVIPVEEPTTEMIPEYDKCSKSDCYGKEACATIYQHAKFKGASQCLIFDDEECVTLDTDFESKVRSLESHNTCVRIYETNDCTGFLTVNIEPSNKYGNNLASLYFDQKVRSLSSCKRSLI